MNSVTVREATTEDVGRLLELEQAIIDSERPYDAFLKSTGAKYYDLDALRIDSNSCLIVAVLEGEIVGSGYAQLRESKQAHTHNHHCYLGFIYLEPEYRGRGLGGVIIDALKEWGSFRGILHFMLDVYADNAAAVRAYEKAGFKKSSITMHLYNQDEK